MAGTVSLAPSGTQVVVGTSTDGLEDYITTGLGAGPSASASGALPFTAAAGRLFETMRTSTLCGSAVVGLTVWLYIGTM